MSKQDLHFHPYRRRSLEPDTRYSSASLRLGTETLLDKTITRPALAPGSAVRLVGAVFLWSLLICICIPQMLEVWEIQSFLKEKENEMASMLSFPKFSILTLSHYSGIHHKHDNKHYEFYHSS